MLDYLVPLNYFEFSCEQTTTIERALSAQVSLCKYLLLLRNNFVYGMRLFKYLCIYEKNRTIEEPSQANNCYWHNRFFILFGLRHNPFDIENFNKL